MYHLYHTSAFVLGGAPSGEGNRILALFTRELGMILALARSVREERSKLRYGLQDFSFSEITLVRGRDSWRVTNATLIENFRATFRAPPKTVLMFARVFRLLRRLLVGEEKNDRLFDAVRDALMFLKDRGTQPVSLENGEIVLVLRILYLLGYLAPRGQFGAVLSDISLWNDSLLSEARSFRSLAVADINNSLRESQL